MKKLIMTFMIALPFLYFGTCFAQNQNSDEKESQATEEKKGSQEWYDKIDLKPKKEKEKPKQQKIETGEENHRLILHPENKVEAKSVSLASTYSLLGTFVPLAAGITLISISFSSLDKDSAYAISGYSLVGAGLIFGPAVGYFYGGEGGRGALGMAIRGLVLAASVGGGMGMIYSCRGSGEGLGCLGTGIGGTILIGAGSLVALIDGIYDLAVLPGNIRKHNLQSCLTVQPLYLVSRRSRTYGLGLNMVF